MIWFLIALISALLSAASAITQKKVLFKIDALEFSLLLSIINLLLSIPFFFIIDYSTISNLSLLILFGKSIIGVLAFLCVMLSLKNLQISNALPLLALTPGFVAIFALFSIGESLKFIEIIGLVLLTTGTYILESKDLKGILSPFKIFITSKYHHYILFALLLFTASSILDKVLLKSYKLTPNAFTAFQHLFFAIIFYLIFVFNSKTTIKKIISENYKELGWITLVSILTIGYRYSQLLAISLAPIALVLAVKRTSVFWATLIGGKIFKDTSLLRKSFAVFIIILGAVLILRD